MIQPTEDGGVKQPTEDGGAKQMTEVKDDDVWIPTLPSLLIRDKKILELSTWLNDRIISAAHSILQQQSGPLIKGWQPTIYEQNAS